MDRLAVGLTLMIAGLPLWATGQEEPQAATAVNLSADWFNGSGVPVQYNSPAAFEAATGRTLDYREAPVLAAMVAAGDLPPVGERLPRDPIVIAPARQIGVYGGTMVIPGDPGWINDEYLRQWALTVPVNGESLLNNVFAAYEPNDDASLYTIRLRDRLHWSDGAPFTTEDIRFWFDRDAANPELNPDGIGNLKTGGVMAELRVIDDLTFQFQFAGSYPTFPNNMMRWFPDSFLAAHYMGQFHPDVAGRDEAESAAREAGFTTWMAYWQEFLIWSNFNPELPVIHPWKLDRKSDTLGVFQRNPYYYKVDAAGNQLPYVDTIRVPLMGMGGDAYLLQGIAGEIDFGLHWDFGDIKNFSVLRKAEQEGDFKLYAAMSPIIYHGTVYFNFAHEEAERRALYNDVNFRRAIALAIDGQEINDLLFRGQYTLSQTPVAGDLVHPASEPYKEFDVDAANRLLDELGLAWNRNRTARTFPSGKPLELFGIVESDKTTDVAMSEIYKEQLKKVGVEFLIRPYAGEVFGEKLTTGDYDLLVAYVDIGRGIPSFSIARFPHVVPTNPAGYHVTTAWARWLHSGGSEGMEPPAGVKRLYELAEEYPRTLSHERRRQIEQEIVAIFSAGLWSISPLESQVDIPQVAFYYFHNRVGNVPAEPLSAEASYLFFDTLFLRR